MEAEIAEISVLSLFEELLEVEESPSGGNNLANDAHGLGSIASCRSEGSVSEQLSKETVISVLEQLDYYEKVSLAFLMCDEVPYILERLVTAERARQAGSLIKVEILSEWLRCQRHGSWENKLVEALCIIQNYQVLEHLGYDTRNMQDRFLPLSPESSLFVNCMRKAMYRMCENLSPNRLEEFLKRARMDYENMNKGQRLEVYDVEFMEINILNWSFQGYINLGDRNGRGVDIHKLKTLLKGMDEMTLLDNLESAERATVNASVGYLGSSRSTSDSMSSTSSSVGSMSTRSDPSIIAPPSITSQHSVASATSQVRRPRPLSYYSVDPQNVGYCLIINQKKFYKDSDPLSKELLAEEDLETRLGTDMDRERLIETFESMGFTTLVKEDLRDDQILDTLSHVVNNVFTRKHSCFVLCIMSHGVKGSVYGSNSLPVSEEQLQDVMKQSHTLQGKPKIIIIQACQGKAHQEVEDIAIDGSNSSSGASADFITFWSTVPGFASFRHEIHGSWFIQALCRHFISFRSTDEVLSLFTQVNADVCSQKALIRGSLKSMVPRFHVTLTRGLILPLQAERLLSVSLRMFKRHLFISLLWEYIHIKKAAYEKKRAMKLLM